jgi:hypothetical protein
MPETAVHKNRNLEFLKNKIRADFESSTHQLFPGISASDFQMPPPSRHAMLPQKLS